MAPREPAEGVPLWPDMVDPFALFCDAAWNWVSLGLGGTIRTHISRLELEASARLLGIAMTPDTFSDIREMEAAAMSYWARKR